MHLMNLFSPAIAMMSSMKYPKKLALATAVFFLPFLLFLYTGYDHIQSESRSIQKLQSGLAYQQSIRYFFEYIPLERGMTVAVQQGDLSYKIKVEENFKRIEAAMDSVDAITAPTPSVTAEWKVIKAQWRELRDGLWKRSSLENYRNHTLLIDKILLLMEHIGIESYTITDADLSIYNLVQILSDHIPALIQYTGQGRAIGMGVILKHSITFDEQKEATILYGKIRSHLDGIIDNSNIACERHPEICLTVAPAVSATRVDSENFSTLFTTHILNTDHWTINPTHYFQDTTHTITTYFNAYDTIAIALQSHLNDRLSHLNRQMVAGWIVALMALSCLIYFTIGFYLAFMGAINDLTGAARLISIGEYVARIPIRTDDEMADVSHAFNDMAKKIGQSFAFLESYKKAVDASNILSITDPNGTITYVNDQFCLRTGYMREELIGKNHRIFKNSETPDEVYRILWKTILDKKIWTGILKNRTKDGAIYYADSVIIPILDEAGEIVEFVSTRHDITQLINQKEQLVHQLHTDTLTHLPNRTKLLEDLVLMKEPALILINIDRFGEINDFYGTETGDAILLAMPERIASSFIPDSFTLYRIYADEFALLCESCSFVNSSCEDFVSLLHSHIEKSPFYVNDSSVIVKVTIGAMIDPAAAVREHTEATHLLTDADMALRYAKRQEKEFAILHDIGTIRQDIARNIEYIGKIRDAIAANRIIPFFQGIIDNQAHDTIQAQPYYQQIIDNRSGLPTKYECLIRLIEPGGKIVSPFLFLDVAKKAKLYPQLTRIMIEKTFLFFQENIYEFSINLSVEDILDPQTVQFILDKLEHSGIANRVIFEILESEGIENFEEVRQFIDKVKQRGGRIAIDDFGSGYSNFAYILNLQVDFIKIDASLIKNIDTDENSRIIVETIVAFAKRLGIKTVAEFVHSKEVFETVKEIGVDFSQGFYFHKPSQYL
ncbi:MAG: EAL domain-containing protein [Sulfuricurvum sp.]|nr:EAL domain-containing protein [Sulfuricurvum sp.]MDD5385656.1 EAL domain-containing protein [Sulfuricurvum sp.]